jgi:hypothetical protein
MDRCPKRLWLLEFSPSGQNCWLAVLGGDTAGATPANTTAALATPNGSGSRMNAR